MSLQRHRPRKRFGQHFLTDRATIARIVEAIAPQASDNMVEIGPGLGALTEPLLDRLARLHVVELDRDLVAKLAARFAGERLIIHPGDALEFDFSSLGDALRVVGNLPYNISSPVLFRFWEPASWLRDCHFMLQREVVERMAAAPGSRAYGRLSVMLQYRFRIEPLLRVRAGAFSPPPEVESAFVRLTPHAPLAGRARDEQVFAQLVAAAFGQRRKTLRNALHEWLDAEQIDAAGVDPGWRAEALGVDQFVQLADRAAARKPPGRFRPAAAG